MTDLLSNSNAQALLAWYVAMGVDEVIAPDPVPWIGRAARLPGHEPRDRNKAELALSRPAERATPRPDFGKPPITPDNSGGGAPSARQTHPTPDPRRALHRLGGQPGTEPGVILPAIDRRGATAPFEEAVMAARELARSAQSLDEMRLLLERFEGCGLKATAKNLCHFRGAARADVMIIGEAPGREEDLEGKPFVGRGGQLLDKMLGAIGLSEHDVHITNVVYWRPPGNRTPTPQETQICMPFLQRQIGLVAPRIIVCLGGAAAKQVLETTEGIMKVRGKFRQITVEGHDRTVMATLHPAYLLRAPAAKRLAWRDLLALSNALKREA